MNHIVYKENPLISLQRYCFFLPLPRISVNNAQ